MRRAKRASATPRSRREAASTASSRAKAEPTTTGMALAPPLAELRRRATKRLRAVARLRALVEREYRAAEEECSRLLAAWPPEAASSKARAAAPDRAEATDGGSSAEVGPQQLVRLEALQTRLRDAHVALEAAEAWNRTLQSRLRAVEAQRVSPRASAGEAEAGPAALRRDAAALQAELRHARAGSDGLRENMTSLLRFLEELSEALSPDRDAAEVPPGS